MHTSKKIHFEISERKVLLRFMDVLFVLAVLLGIGQLFQFTYFQFSKDNYYYFYDN